MVVGFCTVDNIYNVAIWAVDENAVAGRPGEVDAKLCSIYQAVDPGDGSVFGANIFMEVKR